MDSIDEKFGKTVDNGIEAFSENIEKINTLYNRQLEICVDKENIYLKAIKG